MGGNNIGNGNAFFFLLGRLEEEEEEEEDCGRLVGLVAGRMAWNGTCGSGGGAGGVLVCLDVLSCVMLTNVFTVKKYRGSQMTSR